jgi:hypothetical protein
VCLEQLKRHPLCLEVPPKPFCFIVHKGKSQSFAIKSGSRDEIMHSHAKPVEAEL